MGISKKRKEMGEEAWAEYQKKRKRKKSKNSYEKNKSHAFGYRYRRKRELIDYKGGECEMCGYSKDCLRAYDFHHVDSRTKEFNISRTLNKALDVLKKEVDKCILVCKNCHAEIHDNEFLEQRSEAMRIHLNEMERIKPVKINCSYCGKEFTVKDSRNKYCSIKCSHIAKRKVDRPSKEQLEKEISTMSMVAIGKKYGVSNNAVKKWAISYGIECGRKKKL